MKNPADDVKDVSEEYVGGEDLDDIGTGCVVKGEITAVLASSEYRSCKFCKGKVACEDSVCAVCSKCSAVMKVSSCAVSKSAKIIVTDEGGREVTYVM